MPSEIPPQPDDEALPAPGEKAGVWHVTPLGRALLQQILQGLSDSVGRTITSDELGAALRRLRHETGLVDPPFNDPRNIQLLLDLLRDGPEEEH